MYHALHCSKTSTDPTAGAVRLTSSSRVLCFNHTFRRGHMILCHVTLTHHVMLRPTAKQWRTYSLLSTIVTVNQTILITHTGISTSDHLYIVLEPPEADRKMLGPKTVARAMAPNAQ